jgi:exodeoxyribonuclease VII small subunit
MNEAEAAGKAAGRRGRKTPGEADREPDFEESLRRLEAIVSRLEAGELPLEETLRLFEEGQVLVRTCGGLLARAEQRVKELVEGTGEVRDFVGSGAGAANAVGDSGRKASVGDTGGAAEGAVGREGSNA